MTHHRGWREDRTRAGYLLVALLEAHEEVERDDLGWPIAIHFSREYMALVTS